MRPSKLTPWIVLAVALAAAARAQEWACSPWEWVHPEPFPLDLSAVVVRDGAFWGFGASGAAVSADGLTWRRKTVLAGKVTSALWTGREFIGTAGNTVTASPDGTAWSTRHEVRQDPIFFTVDLRAIATDGNRLVVVGESYSGRYSMWSPVLLASADGITWSTPHFPSATDPSHSSLAAVIWTKGRFVAVGSYLLTSPDGESWSKDDTVRGRSLASDGDVVVVADEAGLLVSRDLAVWEPVASPVREGVVRFAAGRFWLAGRCSACADHEPLLWSSADGRAWRRAALDAPVVLRDLVAAGGRLVAVGRGAAASGDAELWRTAHAGASSALSALASDGSTAVAVGERGEVLASEHGGPWRRVLWGGSARLSDVAWGPAGFVAVGEGAALVSADGVAWSSHATPGGAALSKVVASDSGYVAVTWNGSAFTTADGVAWSVIDASGLGFQFNFFHDIVAGDGTVVASVWKRDEGGALIACSDGVSWRKAADTRTGLAELAWGGGRFLATDFDKVLASDDGTSWHEVHAGVEFVGLQWAGNRFIAWTRSGAFFESADGAVWREAGGPAEGATTATGAVLWRVASDGSVRRSVCGAPGRSLYLPSLAHVPGWRGTPWRSDIELHNPGDGALTVGLAATPRGTVTVAGEVGLTLGAGEAIRLDDALASWLGVEDAATVEVTSWGGGVIAAARTYDETAAGSYGQFIPPHPPEAGIAAGGEGRLVHLSHAAESSAGFRTNVGLVDIGPGDVLVDLDLRAGDGSPLGTLRAGLRAGESVQINNILAGFAPTSAATAFAVVRPAATGGRVLAYASVIDNATGDPIYVRPARPIEAGEAAWLPGSGHLGGLGGSAWRTDLELHNPGSREVSCAVDLFPRGMAGGPSGSVTVAVPAGASRLLEDVVWRQFGHEGGATLRVSPAGGAIMASARTYTEDAAGSYGQFVPAMTADEAVTPSSPGRLVMLRQSAVGGTGFRSNVGLVNVTPREAEVEIECHAASGASLGRVVQTLGASESVQLTALLRDVARGSVDDAYAVVRTATPGAAVLAYACLIDNRTNDPVFVPASPE